MSGFAQQPELLQAPTLLMVMCTLPSTSGTIIVTYGGKSLPRTYNTVLIPVARNFGIMIALMLFGCAVYLVATEYISAKKSKGEVLIFRRADMPCLQSKVDEETVSFGNTTSDILSKSALDPPVGLEKQTSIFQWSDVTYDIKVKKETRRLLHQVDGWVQPGTLTALMVSHLVLVEA
jgi:hypothetical protein